MGLAASYHAGCTIDGTPIKVPYGRVPAPYATTSSDGDQVSVEFDGHSLALDFATNLRSTG